MRRNVLNNNNQKTESSITRLNSATDNSQQVTANFLPSIVNTFILELANFPNAVFS